MKGPINNRSVLNCPPLAAQIPLSSSTVKSPLVFTPSSNAANAKVSNTDLSFDLSGQMEEIFEREGEAVPQSTRKEENGKGQLIASEVLIKKSHVLYLFLQRALRTVAPVRS